MKDIKHKKLILMLIAIIVLLILIFIYFKIFSIYRANTYFSKLSSEYAEQNQNVPFSLEKILIYSDAYVEDNSENGNLSNINISQYTDFVVYINNNSDDEELSERNTVNSIYIDNIAITSPELRVCSKSVF